LQVKFLARIAGKEKLNLVGGKPKKINVRVLAAPIKLEEEVQPDAFALTFIIGSTFFHILPALRERKEVYRY